MQGHTTGKSGPRPSQLPQLKKEAKSRGKGATGIVAGQEPDAGWYFRSKRRGQDAKICG